MHIAGQGLNLTQLPGFTHSIDEDAAKEGRRSRQDSNGNEVKDGQAVDVTPDTSTAKTVGKPIASPYSVDEVFDNGMQLLKTREMETSDDPASRTIEVSNVPRERDAHDTDCSQAPESLSLENPSVRDEADASDSKLPTEPSPPAVVDPAAPPSTDPRPSPSHAS